MLESGPRVDASIASLRNDSRSEAPLEVDLRCVRWFRLVGMIEIRPDRTTRQHGEHELAEEEALAERVSRVHHER